MIAELTRRLKARKTARTLTFMELVRKVAAGDTPDVADVEQALAEFGKSADNLAAAVELAHRRTRWAEQLSQAATAEKRRPAIQQQIADADAQLEAARRRHADTVAPLAGELRKIEALSRNARQAKRELERTCADALLLETLATAGDELRVAHAAVSNLEREAQRTEAAKATQNGIEYVEVGRHESLQEQARRHVAAAEKAEELLPSARRRLQQAEQRERKLRAQLLVP